MTYVFSDINYSALSVLGLSAGFLTHEAPELLTVDSRLIGLVFLHVEPTLAALAEVAGMTIQSKKMSMKKESLTISQS